MDGAIMASFFSPLDILRIQSIMGAAGQMGQAGQPDYDISGQDMDVDTMERINRMYQPSTSAIDAYTAAASQMPERSAYEPSRGRKWAAFGASLGAIKPGAYWSGQPVGAQGDPSEAYKLSKTIREEPFTEAREDWAAKLKPLEASAVREQAYNRDQRLYAEQSMRNLINARREARQTKEGQEKLRIAEEKVRIAQQRADANDWKIKHPRHILFTDEHGQVWGVDPTTNKAEQIPGLKATSEADKINMRIE